MTANQIAYWKLQEDIRANKAREDENYRSNLAKEQETLRSNIARESILKAQNVMNAKLGLGTITNNNNSTLLKAAGLILGGK